jgi:hypothetical protein
MQIFPPNRTRVGAEIGAALGYGQQLGCGGTRAAVRGEFLLEEFSHKRVDCSVMFCGIYLGCPEKIFRKVEGYIPSTHINTYNT